METDPVTTTFFGFNTAWIATTLFLLVYAAIISEKVNRAIISLLGAGMMILLGILDQSQALAGIDFNTIGLLIGMMMIVAITRKSGLFQFLAIWSAQKVKAHPWSVLVTLSMITALLSALLDNVTTVLLITPVILQITQMLKINPYPYLFTEILFSNAGGTATFIGDPPNIMIGSAVGLHFNDFIFNLLPVVAIILPTLLIAIYFIWGKELRSSEEARANVMAMNPYECITDWRLLKQSLTVMTIVLIAFTVAHTWHLDAATIALTGAALLLLLDNMGKQAEKQSHNVHHTFAETEWITIFFFIGLFVVVHALEVTGVLKYLADHLLILTRGDLATTAMAILWASAILSAIVDNIPFVATMIPLIQATAPTFGGAENLMPLWWSLSLGACLGGNGTLVGASANLIVAGLGERHGSPISFMKFAKTAFPLMLISIAISAIYIELRYF